MNYRKIYDSIIRRGLLRGIATTSKKNKLTGYEKHHIIPICAGGSNDKSNLVFLTPREHFICHILLVKFCDPIHLKSLRYALGMMRSRGEIISSRMYKFARDQHRIAITNDRIGSMHSLETKLKISRAHLGRKRTPEHCENTRLGQLGKKLSLEHRAKLSEALKGKNLNRTISEKQRSPKTKVTCPHCGLTGGKPVLMRFHFDKCKSQL